MPLGVYIDGFTSIHLYLQHGVDWPEVKQSIQNLISC